MTVEVRQVCRSSKLIGLPLRGAGGESLGRIEEVVLQLERGAIAYVVVATGGLFAFNNHYFAVPWKELVIKHDEDHTYGVIAASREDLKHDEQRFRHLNRWPELVDDGWDSIDTDREAAAASDDDFGSRSSYADPDAEEPAVTPSLQDMNERRDF